MPEMSEEEFEIYYERLRKKKGWRRPKKRWTELTAKEFALTIFISFIIILFSCSCAFLPNIIAFYTR